MGEEEGGDKAARRALEKEKMTGRISGETKGSGKLGDHSKSGVS